MSNDPKLILVFAKDRKTFDTWVIKNLFPGAFNVGRNVHYYRHTEECIYKYVFSPFTVRGMDPSEILLLYGWDNIKKNEKMQYITLFIQIGSKVIGDKEYINNNDWNLFCDMRNKYLYRIAKNFSQDWRFDSIINRFKEMDL